MKLIDKDALMAKIKKLKMDIGNTFNEFDEGFWEGRNTAFDDVICAIDTLEVKDPYEQCIQHSSIKDGIKAHAETYSFNIESELFNQLTKEQQKLWRKEIEQACISGGDAGVELARDIRYKENLELKGVDVEKALSDLDKDLKEFVTTEEFENESTIAGHYWVIAKYAFLLGLKMKGE